jgi:uncharacterized DUF497 family protein
MSSRPDGDFEWDAAKARSNLDKHGVDFADAVPVFEDDRAITMTDHLTAVDEQRFLTVGCDARGRVLVVAYTRRGASIRIFSARKATASERRAYWTGES